MTNRFLVSFAGALVAVCVVLVAIDAQSRPDVRPAAHGYYLFLDQPWSACEACYVPLLVTEIGLEDLAKTKTDRRAMVLTTYERDSLVGAPREVMLLAAGIESRERKVRIEDRRYRYQEIRAAEALSLLEHPGGTIPISRIPSMGIPSQDDLADLIARFRAAGK